MENLLTKYVDDEFLHWKDEKNPRTYMTPPVYKFEDRNIPPKGAHDYNPECYDKTDAHHNAQSVEENVVNVFVRFGDYNNQPMFIFPNFKFEDLVKALNVLLKEYRLLFDIQKGELIPDDYKKETDLIIVHRECGIILVEVKSSKKCKQEPYESAQHQLDNTENLFCNEHLSKYFELDPRPILQNAVIKKVVAYPCHNESEIEKDWLKSGYINLCKNHIATYESFNKWWHTNILPSVHGIQINKYYELVYYNLIPKLLCNPKVPGIRRSRNFMHLTDSEMELVQKELNLQKPLEKQQKKLKAVTNENAKGLDFQEIPLSQEQYKAWNQKRQVIYGPYGSGKTKLIQYKVVNLAFNGDKVLIILPTDCLVRKYKMFSHDYFVQKGFQSQKSDVTQTKYVSRARKKKKLVLTSM